MGYKFRTSLFIMISLIFSMSLNMCKQNSELTQTNSKTKLLFIGNSFTFIHGGLEVLLRDLAASAIPPKHIQVDSQTLAGATLAINYDIAEVHKAIKDGSYDVVILQGDIPELTEKKLEPFYRYARLFHEEIKGVGSETMFFMTWPYERLNWISLNEITDAHAHIGTELKADVAPVGIAFQRSITKNPELHMLLDDQEHESVHGFYLAACVIYATLFDQSPVGLAYNLEGISIEEKIFLQGIAWEAVQEWRKIF
jgi:hypothetical protein